jgi:crossover junction endodeoxyribonuclease RuvC
MQVPEVEAARKVDLTRVNLPRVNQAIRIIGIDPGLIRTGWGVIQSLGSRLSFIAAGTIRPKDSLSLAERLCVIHDELQRVMDSFGPHEAAVEATFVNGNAAATLKLGQARGIAMLVPARSGIAVSEYAPNVVKKAVVGAGHAEKQQIRMMVSVLLPRAEFDTDDSADALAIAICHAHHRGVQALRVSTGAA